MNSIGSNGSGGGGGDGGNSASGGATAVLKGVLAVVNWAGLIVDAGLNTASLAIGWALRVLLRTKFGVTPLSPWAVQTPQSQDFLDCMTECEAQGYKRGTQAFEDCIAKCAKAKRVGKRAGR